MSYILFFIALLQSPAEQGFSQQDESGSYIVAFLTPIKNEDLSAQEIQVIENNHLRNIGRLSEDGLIANAGPFEGAGEFIIFNSKTLKETESILEMDPAVKNGLLEIEILSLQIRTGSICDPLIPYEMKTYTFVRFLPTNQIASYKTNTSFDMNRLHQGHLNKLVFSEDVLMEGLFSGNDGGILIYKGNTLDNRISEDPAIKEGYLKADFQTIWLNKGSFCDQ